MTYSVFDIETNGLLDTVSLIHCLSYTTYTDGKVVEEGDLTDYGMMELWCSRQEVLVGHNIIRYDIPVLKKILGVSINARLIDTLGISWYLRPQKEEHGLEAWGEEFGILKPVIEDWSNLTKEEYIHRCREDVKINTRLFHEQIGYLQCLYADRPAIDRIMGYITYKLECAAEQEEMRWRLDVPKTTENLATLNILYDQKLEALKGHMPKVIQYKYKKKPAVMFKKDGMLSEHGKKWVEALKEHNLPADHEEPIKLISHYDEPKPGSPEQVKNWLFSLGWVPITFEYVKDKKDKKKPPRKVPQINTKDNGICESIKVLYPQHPFLEDLEGAGILKHRRGLLKGFLETQRDGWVIAHIGGFTNTMRFKHKVLTNLPQIPKPYWEEVRGCLIAPEGMELCGSDMSSLEDNTKQHYMYFYDPQYVTEMRSYGFDPHCDISVLAKKMSRDEECFYKWHTAVKEGKDFERILREYMQKNLSYEDRVRYGVTGKTLQEILALDEKGQAAIMKQLKPIRLKNKKVNFAAVYGAYPPKLAITADIILPEAEELFNIYWYRNKSVNDVADNCEVKTVNGQMWLFNPVSQFWYTLRFDKDRFSTLNQSTGVYCFDSWNRKVRQAGIKLCGQFHDEIIFPLHHSERQRVTAILQKAIDDTNDEIQLNVKLSISVDFGTDYSKIH